MAARTVSCLGKVSFLSSRSEKRDMWEKRVKCMEKGSFPLRTENKKQRGVGLDKTLAGSATLRPAEALQYGYGETLEHDRTLAAW